MSSNSTTEIQKLYEDLHYLKKEKLEDTARYLEIYNRLNHLIQILPSNGTENTDNDLPLKSEKPVLSQSQVFQLKNQILAFKYLAMSQTIPKNVMGNIGQLTQNQWNQEIKNNLKTSCDAKAYKKEKTDGIIKKLISDSLGHGNAYKTDKMEKIMGEIKAFSQTYLRKRKAEIDLLISSELISTKTHQKLEIEKEFLDVFPVYNTLKKEIFEKITKYSDRKAPPVSQSKYYDRDFYKRKKPQRKQDKRLDVVELHIKKEQTARRKEKHRNYLQTVFNYNHKIKTYFRKKRKTLRKVSNNVKLRHEWLQRKSRRELDLQDNKRRTEALKAENFEEYRNMILKAKDKRIFEILQETDNYLREIVSKVVQMKKNDGEMNIHIEEENSEWLKLNSNSASEYDLDKSTMLTKNYQKYYFNLTHTNIEEVKEQPSILENGTLKSYQLIGLQWMVSLYNNKLNGILADEMGLGKTIQTISLFCYLMEFKQNYGPFMIVVPLTTLPNWVMEFEKWAPTIKLIVYNGDQTKRKALSYLMKTTKWNICLTTYEFILRDKTDLSKFHWKYIVVDEGHKMKNPKSKFAQTLGQVYKSDYRLLLTGTPLQNNLPELWALLNFLLPKVFSSCDDFERWFKTPMKKFGNEKEAELNEEEQLLIIRRFHHVLRPFLLRRIKKEVESELPDKVEYVIMVELSGWQKIVYKQISNKESMAIQPSQVGIQTSTILMNMMMQLRKICNHPYLFLNGDYLINDDLFRTSAKFELLDRILPKIVSTGHRILMFTQMTRLMDILEVFLRYRGFKFLRLDGTTKAEDRAVRMAQFNRAGSQFPIFILSTKAGGLGLNLQTADTVILIDSDWNPQIDAQAQDRAHRIGQTKEVRVFRLITNTAIERAILSRASYKKSLDEMVIQTGLYNQNSTEQERKTKIEALIKTKDDDDEIEEDEVCNDTEINKMLARTEEEVELFAKMDQQRYEIDKRVYTNFKEDTHYRVMTEEQVPNWVKTPKEKKAPEVLGRRRGRKNPSSWMDLDFLDDDQYFERIDQVPYDDDKDPEYQRNPSKKNRSRKKIKKPREKKVVVNDPYLIDEKNPLPEEEIFMESE